MSEGDYTILLVEDSEADAILFREILADTSYSEHKLISVDRISDAMEILDNEKVDIIVLDLNLPDSQGFDTFTNINNKYENIPIIIYTITDDEDTALEAIRRGAEDYLVKGPYLDTVQIEKSIRKAIELNNSRKAIRKSLRDLQRTNGYLEHFAYVASHDLNAPIINLEELSKMVDLKGAPRERNQLILDKINSTIERMRLTLNGLFKVMDTHEKLDAPLEDLRFEDVTKKVLQEMDEEIKNRDARVEYDFSGAPAVRFPAMHLRVIISQLLDNALKHQRKEVDPVIRIRSYDRNSEYLCLEVDDNGIGFNEELHSERIFDLFNRPHQESSHSGIGLYTVKTLAENHEGQVEAESKEEGTGSVFRVCFSKHP